MHSFKYSKNKENISNNINYGNPEKIVINSITDLLKIPIHKINHSKLENFSGLYFDKIYEEAIKSENNQDSEDIPSPKKVPVNKSKKKVHKEKKAKAHEYSKNENSSQHKNKNKSKKANSNENKINYINNNNKENDVKEFYTEELEVGLPEVEQEKDSDDDQYRQEIKNDNIIMIPNTMKKKMSNKKLSKKKHKKGKNINITPIDDYQKQDFKINNLNNNYITPLPSNRQVYMYGQMVTPGNEDDNDDFYAKNNYYMPTPTPTPTPMGFDDNEDKKDNNENPIYPLNKIIFSIDYNSLFGEEVGILGSSPKLGQWRLSEALLLKWNFGNMWTGEINVEVEDLQDFEFKFVIIENNKIKYWESGNNNIVNFTGLINEFQFNKIGRYNKYEYEYNQNDGTLLIKCHWHK